MLCVVLSLLAITVVVEGAPRNRRHLEAILSGLLGTRYGYGNTLLVLFWVSYKMWTVQLLQVIRMMEVMGTVDMVPSTQNTVLVKKDIMATLATMIDSPPAAHR